MQQGSRQAGAGARERWGARLVAGVPALWLLAFFVLPFLLVLRISVLQMDGAQLGELFVRTEAGGWRFNGQWQSYELLFSDSLYLSSYGRSLFYAAATTLICLAIGYPFAYFMARSALTLQPLLLMGVMLPFWTSFLLRVYAWKGLLDSETGWLGRAIVSAGLDQPLAAMGLIPAAGQLLYSPFSLLLGMVYTYLPFMVLPLYATLAKMDLRLLEAAQDLGATPWQAFWRITVPLSRGGIMAGSMLVFIPCVGEYVIPELLGGPETLLIGRVLWDEFFANNDWPMACAVATVMILLILVPLAALNRSQERANAEARQ